MSRAPPWSPRDPEDRGPCSMPQKQCWCATRNLRPCSLHLLRRWHRDSQLPRTRNAKATTRIDKRRSQPPKQEPTLLAFHKDRKRLSRKRHSLVNLTAGPLENGVLFSATPSTVRPHIFQLASSSWESWLPHWRCGPPSIDTCYIEPILAPDPISQISDYGDQENRLIFPTANCSAPLSLSFCHESPCNHRHSPHIFPSRVLLSPCPCCGPFTYLIVRKTLRHKVPASLNHSDLQIHMFQAVCLGRASSRTN